MDEIKKENFDLKLRVSLLQDRLSRSTPENIESALSEVSYFMCSVLLFIINLLCRMSN